MELKIIPFEYCSLERAAKFFECEIEDFFHWYETKKISLSLKLLENRATLLAKDDKCIELNIGYWGDDQVEFDPAESVNNEYSYADDLSVFVGNQLSYDRLAGVYRVNGYAYDFWKPCDPVIQALRNGGRIREGFSASPYDNKGDFRIIINVKEDFQFSTPDSPVASYYPDFSLGDLVLHKNDLNVVNHLICGLEYKDQSQINKNTVEFLEPLPLEKDDYLDWNEFSSKETSLKFITGMVLTLQKLSPKFRNGNNLNRTSIAKEAISMVMEQGVEFDITERQLTNLMNKALMEYAPKIKE